MLDDRRDRQIEFPGNRHRRAIGGMDRVRRGPIDDDRLYVGDLLKAKLRKLFGGNVTDVDQGSHYRLRVRLLND